MSKLEQLITELCPNGVEYVNIGSVVNYEQPSKYIVKSTNYNDNFEIPVLTAGKSFILGYTNETENVYKAARENPVIIFDDFTAAFKWVDFPFKVKSSAMKMLTATRENTTLRYVFHVMSSIGYFSDEHKRLWINTYSKFQIPLPPLPVQAEIVRILDNFTELTAELAAGLTAELTARKKQYEYYKESLLTAKDRFELKPLGEVCTVQAGGTPSKNVIQYWKNGTIKWLGSSVCKNQKTVDEITNHITELGLLKSSAKLMKKDTTLIALVGATIGKVAFLPFEATINQNIAGVYPIDEEVISPSYIYYACTTLYSKFLDLGKEKFAMANLSFVRSLQIPIPYPNDSTKSLKEQQRIVDILDRFDALCNDISSGLPAEINARQKQYEYYRDKLLTFSKAE